jgi:RimJ/RimL family protein N-acetyltransferase
MNPDPLDGITLTRLAQADLDQVHAIRSDPGTHMHDPTGRPTDSESTQRVIDMSQRSWDEHGFGLWTVRLADGTVAGTCGAFVASLPVWNLGYRLSPATWGRGLASAAAARAVEMARAADSELPIIARVLATNPGSARVAEKAGLVLVWRGPSMKGPERLILSDREPSAAVLDSLIALG